MEQSRDEIIKRLLEKYWDLSEREAEELYDAMDEAYNEAKAVFLDALWEPESSELASILLNKLKTLLAKMDRSVEDNLMLVALLDIFSTDLHDKYIARARG